jgi:hypothetical protein
MCEEYKKQKREQEKSFRIAAKKILLTYSQISKDTEFTINQLLEQLQYKLGKFNYIISQEAHSDGAMHFHVLLIRSKKFDIRSHSSLDLEIDGRVVHGNYKAVNNIEGAVHYVCKDKQYITNLENLQDGKILDDKEFLLQRAKTVGYEEALFEYSVKYPKKALTSIKKFKNNLQEIQQIQDQIEDDLLESPFQIENFNLQTPLKQWVQDPNLYHKKTLILVGKSGIGKTEFAKVFALKNNFKTLVVNHKEGFQRIKNSYQAIIVDDANVNEFTETQLLALIDNSTSKSIRIMYKTVRKKKGVVTIILMNHQQFNHIKHLLKQEAFARRSVICEPQSPFMINVNINIQNNVHHGDVNIFQNRSENHFERHQLYEKTLIQENQKRCRDISEKNRQ